MTNPSEALKPCPFCVEIPETMPSGSGNGLMIQCMTDSCLGPHCSYIPPSKAIEVWNMRTTPKASPAHTAVDLEGVGRIVLASLPAGGNTPEEIIDFTINALSSRGLLAASVPEALNHLKKALSAGDRADKTFHAWRYHLPKGANAGQLFADHANTVNALRTHLRNAYESLMDAQKAGS